MTRENVEHDPHKQTRLFIERVIKEFGDSSWSSPDNVSHSAGAVLTSLPSEINPQFVGLKERLNQGNILGSLATEAAQEPLVSS